MNQRSSQPPQDINTLIQRGKDIAGQQLGDLAHELGISVPTNLKREKGWQGQLIERCWVLRPLPLPPPILSSLEWN